MNAIIIKNHNDAQQTMARIIVREVFQGIGGVHAPLFLSMAVFMPTSPRRCGTLSLADLPLPSGEGGGCCAATVIAKSACFAMRSRCRSMEASRTFVVVDVAAAAEVLLLPKRASVYRLL